MGASPFHLLLLIAPLLDALRFGTFETRPFVMKKRECWDESSDYNSSACNENNRYEGYCVDMMDLLAKEMNVDYTIHTINGTFGSLVDDLEASRVDAVVARLIADQQRAALVDFSSFYTSGLSMITRKSHFPTRRVPLNPYSSEACGIIVFLETLGAIAWYVLFGYVKETPKQRKQICLVWLICTLIWIACTLVLLISTLCHAYEAHNFNTKYEVEIRNYAEPIEIDGDYESEHEFLLRKEDGKGRYYKSIENMVEVGEMKYGIPTGGYTEKLLKKSNDTLIQKMMKTMERYGSNYTEIDLKNDEVLKGNASFFEYVADGFNHARENVGRFAFIFDDAAIDFETIRKPCDLMKIGDKLATYDFAVATKKGSVMSGQVSKAMEVIKGRGDLEKLREKWFVERSQCEIMDEDEPVRKTTVEQIADYAICGLIGAIVVAIITIFILAYVRKPTKPPVKNPDEAKTMKA
ncbi:hypothetical protein PMAYCL1PPCAC_26934 [Pristionchus mayeri]|uniref:Ionotropic glutamate receptor C-terminal domain-containing protein n=1 Tax=Pristionchus mayeri TaxID=1317129 RepID=A0AAN5D6X3_9BILA|nr:hypothetical protein PMAYCL1PPCAC_26934 [Pristionchus mayeri]